MSERWKELHALLQADWGNAAERAEASVEELRAALDRLALLERWLEARGLPADFAGPLDSWGWIVFEGNDRKGRMVGRGPSTEDLRHLPNVIRWDRATPAQKAEALRLESLRVEREDGK